MLYHTISDCEMILSDSRMGLQEIATDYTFGGHLTGKFSAFLISCIQSFKE